MLANRVNPQPTPWECQQNSAMEFDADAFDHAVQFMRRFSKAAPEIISRPNPQNALRAPMQAHYESEAGFALTSGLASLAPSAIVMVLEDELGMPHHSCLRHPTQDLMLDASGLHAQQQLLDYWYIKLAKPAFTLSLRVASANEIWLYGCFDDKRPEAVISDFGRLVRQDSVLIRPPHRPPLVDV
ncbi:hypothetical protein DV532_29300 (plasmid) [Pseudomonas sp. Leaf58]|uniref:hypothetical protein n=1 Tax=Pseudomonas sp. Leaf58 TaxID=1736226 RepID=UPI0006FA272E|nr:hypothetical protein [Pseudomonas sp. Leaf58]AYG48344.1 hypothetical protein DV532_29300 [Pseudomonas sp. Leaf58]KQN62111.1 hypothetical protein ASF02_07990 [Pseudomonas sp. Leaf58]